MGSAQALELFKMKRFVVDPEMPGTISPESLNSLPLKIENVFDLLGLRLTPSLAVLSCPVMRGYFPTYRRQDWYVVPYKDSPRAAHIQKALSRSA